jgi:hypothetical protein
LSRRGALLGIVCLVAVALPAAAALGALGVERMSFGTFITFKALFAGVLATAVTPLVARAALAD